jgi:hypothetical protein
VQGLVVANPAAPHYSEKELISMNSNVSIPHPKNDQYEYYPLDTNTGYALLAEDHEIVVIPESGQVILVNWERRHLVMDCLFPTQECAVLMTLLDAWPSYVPTDELLTGVRSSPAYQQQGPGQDMPLSHLRTVLSGCQERLHSLGLDVIPVGEQGFLLVRFHQLNREEQADRHEDQGDPSAHPAAREEGD